MNITITGSLGNISKPLAQKLIKAGNQVTIISSSADKQAAIEALGAKAAIGSLTDANFLTNAFTGADVVYTMVPPDLQTSNFLEHATAIGQSYAAAIQKAGVKQVVNLSSIGAHLETGTGPIKGLHVVEAIFNKLENVAVKHIRAPFFYINFYGNLDMIRHMGIIGSNYGGDDRLVLVHPVDIAEVIFNAINEPFSGKDVTYLVSDERTAQEVATVLGTAIGKPGLQWVAFTDEQALGGMLQAGGLSEEMAKNFVEMGTAVRSGILWEHYDQNKPTKHGSVKLEDFAKEFAAVYNH